jgi:hypothetical protein
MAKKIEDAAVKPSPVAVDFIEDQAIVILRVPAADLLVNASREAALHPRRFVVNDLLRRALDRAGRQAAAGRRLLDLTAAELARASDAALLPVHNGEAIVEVLAKAPAEKPCC